MDVIITLLQENLWLRLFATTLLGLSVGSFLNVVIYRLPKMLFAEWRLQCHEMLSDGQSALTEEAPRFNLATPRSACPHCNHQITALENIPVLSYLALKGKCSACKAPISIRYPLVELVTALLSCLVIWHFGFTWSGGAAMLLTWALIALSMIDFDHQILPDNITLPFLWLGLLLSLVPLFVDPVSSIIGATAGYLSLWSVYWLFKLLTGKEGMGYGDFKLLAVLGAWFGWKPLLLTILLSSAVGAVVGITMIVALGRDRTIPIPFGPYIASAGWINLMVGEHILTWYSQFYL